MLLRKIISSTARRFPPTRVSDRNIPLDHATLAVLGGTWTLIELQDNKNGRRVQRVIELHEFCLAQDLKFDFSAKIKGTIDSRKEQLDRSFCLYVEEIINTQEHHSNIKKCNFEMTNLTEIILSKYQKRDGRSRLDKIIGLAIDEDLQLNAMTHSIAHFFAGVAICVERNACGTEMAANYLLIDMINFFNSACPLFDITASNERVKAIDVFLAHFIVKTLLTMIT